MGAGASRQGSFARPRKACWRIFAAWRKQALRGSRVRPPGLCLNVAHPRYRRTRGFPGRRGLSELRAAWEEYAYKSSRMTCAHAHTRVAAMGREGHLEAISGGRRDFFSPHKWIDVYGKIMFLTNPTQESKEKNRSAIQPATRGPRRRAPTEAAARTNVTGSFGGAEVEAAALARGLNPSQAKAVAESTRRRMTLVHGPPGTGKTRTAVEVVRQWVLSGRMTCG